MDSERRRVFRERAEHKAEWKTIPLAPFELLALLDAADERDRLRETNARLHRRCQLAESQIKTTVDDCRRQGVSFGRILANAACEMAEAERDRLREAVNEVLRLVRREEHLFPRTKRIADILDAAIEGRE